MLGPVLPGFVHVAFVPHVAWWEIVGAVVRPSGGNAPLWPALDSCVSIFIAFVTGPCPGSAPIMASARSTMAVSIAAAASDIA